MKPYQVHLFNDEAKVPRILPADPVFIHENRRYLNFATLDCRHLCNNEHLKETAKLTIEERGLAPADSGTEITDEIKKRMADFKKTDSLILFPDEITAVFAICSLFDDKVTYFADHETSPGIRSVLQHRNCELYSHQDLEHLRKVLNAHSNRVVVIDGLYEWVGNIAPVTDLIKAAQEQESIVIANELNSFGLLGRDGRGFVDLFNLYDDINFEVGSFKRFLGGFGCYVAAKKYLLNQIEENIAPFSEMLPPFLLAINVTALDLIRNEKTNKAVFQKLWNSSRYFINRLKQVGFKTRSETPVIVFSMNNNDEAVEFSKRLFDEGIITEQHRERIRLSISVEHTRADLDFCLDRLESIARDAGFLNKTA
jgi:7-keto-8-aminopelargonate synthetase-like enzyme